jgi:hypothetical protein
MGLKEGTCERKKERLGKGVARRNWGGKQRILNGKVIFSAELKTQSDSLHYFAMLN